MMTLEEFKSIFEVHGLEINEFLSLDKQTDAIVYIPTVYGKVKGLDDACDARWFQIDELPKLGFHHEQIINDFLKED